jgi:ABC-type multidrug transport system fused ATPase/permease subunit
MLDVDNAAQILKTGFKTLVRFIAVSAFHNQHVGALNGQIEEAFTGHALVKAFGRQREVEERFAAKNDELYKASFGAQFASGLIQPAMTFIGNLNFVAIAVVGGLRVSAGAITIGDIQAFIQYSRQFTQPLTQVASMANVLQSGIASVSSSSKHFPGSHAVTRARQSYPSPKNNVYVAPSSGWPSELSVHHSSRRAGTAAMSNTAEAEARIGKS